MFHHCKTKEDVKKLYFKICQYLHPDKGGDPSLFSLLHESYEIALELKNISHHSKKSEGKYENAFDDVWKEDNAEELKIIDEIYLYANEHKKFNTDYLDSVKEYLEQNGYITSCQYNCLVKTYYAFKMHVKT